MLSVLEIFDSLQGEGHWTGIPMTFVRLAGCNAPRLGLTCTAWCDTPEGWQLEEGRQMEVDEVVMEVGLPRLCITGGEPLLQREQVAALAAGARKKSIKVHIETNGTIAPPAPCARVFDWATVSPKPPKYEVVREWDGLVQELKFVVDENLEAATVERVAAGYPEAVVFIQPAWGRQMDKKAAEMVMAHPEWRLSLQIHKYLGLA